MKLNEDYRIEDDDSCFGNAVSGSGAHTLHDWDCADKPVFSDGMFRYCEKHFLKITPFMRIAYQYVYIGSNERLLHQNKLVGIHLELRSRPKEGARNIKVLDLKREELSFQDRIALLAADSVDDSDRRIFIYTEKETVEKYTGEKEFSFIKEQTIITSNWLRTNSQHPNIFLYDRLDNSEARYMKQLIVASKRGRFLETV